MDDGHCNLEFVALDKRNAPEQFCGGDSHDASELTGLRALNKVVETAGVEPASESPVLQTSTYLVCC